ncbi:hypothetical protein HPP92_014001 [Vanilla planifolia]|uniref:Uncharacterized protein n=1 Tax=Vanilla planifolia TaxID=51239 RepID=A0A835UYI6_VANPL|nr:hypothetical protein HPP92_014001 [Vanilla planifolia]
MADINHLEKMRRELKCPICLSLLKSAVSLTCNHVFCNSCIVESMRVISNCPVCKVPLCRREVRPAPHMDNLVSIYKSMEAASGLNMVISQVAPPKHSARPSFPSNKRIHVTPYPVSETPIQQKKAIMSGTSTIEAVDRTGLDNNKILTNEMQEDPSLPPFFWLRDTNEKDDGPEKFIITRESTGLSPTASTPCFSDIKDSDDCRTPKHLTPNSKYTAKEYVDSEIFQWTQRDCSPELFLTPAKKQDAKEIRSSELQEDEQVQMFLHSKNHSRDLDRSKASHLGENRTAKVIYFKETLKKIRKRSKAKKVDDLSYGTAIISLNEDNHFGSIEPVERLRQERKLPQHKGPLRSSRKTNKRNLKATELHLGERTASPLKECNETTVADKYTGASNSGIPNQNMDDASRMVKFPSESSNKFIGYGLHLKNKFMKGACGNTCKLQGKRKACSLDHSISRRSCTSRKINANEEKSQKRGLEKSKPGLQLFSCRQDKGEGSSRVKSKIKNIQTLNQSRLDLNDVGVVAANSSNAKPRTCTIIDDMGDIQLCMNQRNVLKKCTNSDSPTPCAFCHSSSVSEVSGEIMHYSDGKLVAADYNGGVNVIHSHKNCTEWAPEVYFKDDLVINLPTELARSRRITCSYCGIKGAALGCFEKSCRKSFHYLCAKKTPECRWDNENFVMLCPLHYSSKLPCETPELQKQNKKRFASKGEAQTSSQSKATDEKSCMWTWPSGSPRKWVLCSSALSDDEKAILYEFARLTGISISKTWSSVVTHVITSIDENGACRRTLKFLMGILEGKWILSIEWIKECMKFMKPVEEEKYEIGVDVHGICNGPRLGRMRILNKEPKIFNKLWFYFMGDFIPAYKGYLQDLTMAAGGRVLQRRPISREQEKLLDDYSEMTIIVYSTEPPENNCMKKAEAMALAQLCGAKVVTNSWILDSIAASGMKLPLC